MKKYCTELPFTHCLSMPVGKFRSVETWRTLRNVINPHDIIMYAGRYEKSLCSDNDPRCYSPEMKIISSDWIALITQVINTI